MEVKKHYYLMISCPSDVVREHKLLKQCVDSINEDREDDVWVELRFWVTDTSSDAAKPAQESINQQILEVCDGLIAIFNGRLGTPVHKYKCGTDEEITLMLKANKHVSILFNTNPTINLSRNDCVEQLEKLRKYKSDMSSEVYYREFNDDQSFMDLARREIHLWLRNLRKSAEIAAGKDEANLLKSESTATTKASSNKGSIDYISHITNVGSKLMQQLNQLTQCSEDLIGQATHYKDSVTTSKMQKNGSSNLLVAAEQFSFYLTNFNTSLGDLTHEVESSSKGLYHYLMSCDKKKLEYDDRLIVKDYIQSLENAFQKLSFSLLPRIISVISHVPDLKNEIKNSADKPNLAIFSGMELQNDIKNFADKTVEICKSFSFFARQATDKCRELEIFEY